MKKRESISKIMTSNPITVNSTNSISDVADIFNKHSIHHLPVVSGKQLIGIISKTDLERISFVTEIQDQKANTAIYDNLTIHQIMTSNQLDTIDVDESIRDAAVLLATGKYHALPVTSQEELVGIVTSTDIIRYMLNQY